LDLDLDILLTPDELAKYFEQSSRPCNSDPFDLRVRLLKGYKMIIKKGTNRITLYKFLLAKLLYSLEGLALEEYLLVFQLYFELTEIRDPLFVSKHGDFLQHSLLLLNAIKEAKYFPVQTDQEEGGPDVSIFEGAFPTKRQYFGLAGQRDLRRSFRLILNDTIVPQKLPPARFIGVGYKDKGSRRDPAFDGSPGWKEVASFNSYHEREAEELDSSTTDSHEMEEQEPRF